MPSENRLQDVSSEPGRPKAKRRQQLSKEQLQRKRASDREAQRALREKTRNRVAHLESLVKELQGGHEGHADGLIAQLDEQRGEIARLRAALSNVGRIADLVKTALDPVSLALDAQNQARANASNIEHGLGPPTKYDPFTDEPSDLSPGSRHDLQTSPEYPDSRTPHESGGVANKSGYLQPISITQMASAIVEKRDLPGRFWYLAGTLLRYGLRTQQGHPIYTVHDEDIAIRAVFEGWSAVLERYPLDRGWQLLRELDETIYFHCSPQYRLTYLRNSRLQFLHQLDPDAGWNKALPIFYSPTPSQQHIEHDPLIEHFPWPGFREHALLSPRRFATNAFMEALRRNVHFTWPFSPNDLYVKDAATGTYSYSDTLNQQIMDIWCYTADRDFFQKFPELRYAIPPDPTSLALTLSPCSTIASNTYALVEGDDQDAPRSVGVGGMNQRRRVSVELN